MTETQRHPECQPDELYMCNTTAGDFATSDGWKTKRLGKQPFKADGTPCVYGDLFPWFVKRAEVEKAIEDERNENREWSSGRIETLEKMLANGGIVL